MASPFWLLGIVLLSGLAWTHVFDSLGYPLRRKTAGSNGHSVLRSEAQPNCFARFYSPSAMRVQIPPHPCQPGLGASFSR